MALKSSILGSQAGVMRALIRSGLGRSPGRKSEMVVLVSLWNCVLALQPDWFIAVGSLGSALLALALALGLKEWILRPRITLLLRHRSMPDAISDCVVTRRIDTGETAAFVRLRLDNRGRSTARRVGVRVLQVHQWAHDHEQWIRARPELEGRQLRPSNQLLDRHDADLLDVFPASDRIIALVSVDCDPESDGSSPILLEIGYPRPPNHAHALEPGTWKLELLVCGDNIDAQRYFVVVSFDGRWTEGEHDEIWDHFRVDGPSTTRPLRPSSGAAGTVVGEKAYAETH